MDRSGRTVTAITTWASVGSSTATTFFDLLADGVVFEYVITVPGYPRHVVGRSAVAELYRPYGDTFVLHRCFDLAVHHDRESGVVVLEYASQGRVVATGAAYANRYISVLTIVDRKVTRWRDYLDPIAVFEALGWPSRHCDSNGEISVAKHPIDAPAGPLITSRATKQRTYSRPPTERCPDALQWIGNMRRGYSGPPVESC